MRVFTTSRGRVIIAVIPPDKDPANILTKRELVFEVDS